MVSSRSPGPQPSDTRGTPTVAGTAGTFPATHTHIGHTRTTRLNKLPLKIVNIQPNFSKNYVIKIGEIPQQLKISTKIVVCGTRRIVLN